MKVLFLTKYSSIGASSRMRTFQYLEFYRAAGIECTVQSLFADRYLKNLYNGKSNAFTIIFSFVRRLFQLFRARQYDLVYIEKEIFPYLPPCAEYLFGVFSIKYVVDYDDAIFHNYDLSNNALIRILLSNKIDNVMRGATAVIAGNTYLAARAKNSGASNVHIIPTVVDSTRYYPSTSSRSQNLIVGWIGTRSTYEKHFLLIKEWLIAAQQLLGVQIHVIGVSEIEKKKHPSFTFIPWKSETEAEELARIDIGLMPLSDSPWERGKCAYKIIQYMASGKPVLASDVGVNNEVCIEGRTGYLPRTQEEFLTALNILSSAKKREEMGGYGREMVEKHYCISVTAPLMVTIIRQAANV